MINLPICYREVSSRAKVLSSLSKERQIFFHIKKLAEKSKEEPRITQIDKKGQLHLIRGNLRNPG
jgi:hypothetical protein